jgi:hypothetical protein
MRGQTKTVKSLTLTGNVYLRNIDDEKIANPKTGDIYLYLNDEEELYPVLMSDYQIKGYKGYFKMKIYDGRAWCFMDSLDFFEDRLHQFGKNEICFYTYELCHERMIGAAGTVVYKTYREHYTTYIHEAGEYKGKKGLKKK